MLDVLWACRLVLNDLSDLIAAASISGKRRSVAFGLLLFRQSQLLCLTLCIPFFLTGLRDAEGGLVCDTAPRFFDHRNEVRIADALESFDRCQLRRCHRQLRAVAG